MVTLYRDSHLEPMFYMAFYKVWYLVSFSFCIYHVSFGLLFRHLGSFSTMIAFKFLSDGLPLLLFKYTIVSQLVITIKPKSFLRLPNAKSSLPF